MPKFAWVTITLDEFCSNNMDVAEWHITPLNPTEPAGSVKDDIWRKVSSGMGAGLGM